jgi:hypothetical protein
MYTSSILFHVAKLTTSDNNNESPDRLQVHSSTRCLQIKSLCCCSWLCSLLIMDESMVHASWCSRSKRKPAHFLHADLEKVQARKAEPGQTDSDRLC